MARSDVKVYWDSCCFIGLIQQEAGRYPACRSVYDAAERGDVTIVTSTLSLSEVCKVRCEREADKKSSLPEENDHILENFFNNDFFDTVDLTPAIATSARTLFRRYPEIGKPNDAVHLATALFRNVDVMHTFDGSDLIKLDGLLRRRDGEPLPISAPIPYRPAPTPLEEAIAVMVDEEDKKPA